VKFIITPFAMSLNTHSEISHMLLSVTTVGYIIAKSYCKDLNTIPRIEQNFLYPNSEVYQN